MTRSAVSTFKKFARRHHLLCQTDLSYDELVPESSVFRQAGAHDDVLVTGVIEDTDLMLAQRRFYVRARTGDSKTPLLVTIGSTLIKEQADPFLFVNRRLPAAYSLRIKHLRNHWQHTHWPDGYLLQPPHVSPPRDNLQHLTVFPATVEVSSHTLVTAAPAISDEPSLELFVRQLRQLRASLEG